jgi:glycosyltransferase involved in cell wall biosynthesis
MTTAKRILYVTLIPDISRPSGYRARTLAAMQAAQEQGVKVYLLALSPGKLVASRVAQRNFHQALRRLGLSGSLVPHSPSFRTRWGKWVMIASAAAVVSVAQRVVAADVVHGENHYATIVSLLARRITRAPVVFDAHGVFPEETELIGRTSGMNSRRLAWEIDLARDLERRCWHEADAVIAVSDALIEHLAQRYGPRSGMTVRIPCAISADSFVQRTDRERVRSELALPGRRVVVYVGSLAPYQMAPEMLRQFAAIHQHDPAAYLLIVSQAPAARWHAIARRAEVTPDSYCVVGVPHERVPELTAAGDMGLMLREESCVNRVAFPTKLAEYLAAGVPVLATAAARDPARFIGDNAVGYIVDDIRSLKTADACAFLGDVCARREEWAARCRLAVARQLTWSTYTPTLLATYAAVRTTNTPYVDVCES